MTGEQALEIFLDALKDSALVFLFVFAFHILISFFEKPLANFLIKHRRAAPAIGSLFGLIPQCGTSVLGADLYIKRLIGMGALIAIFLSCSDEAVIVVATSGPKWWTIFPLLGIKFIIGMAVGFVIELILSKKQQIVDEEYHGAQECHEHHHEMTPLHAHLLHPLFHSLKLFAYVLITNLALGFLIGFVGEENFAAFIMSSRYFSPLFASLVGLIPNCAASVLLSELYIGGNLSFGALTAGLLVNSGLGIMVLLKDKHTFKQAWIILLICFLTAVTLGYLICLVPLSGF